MGGEINCFVSVCRKHAGFPIFGKTAVIFLLLLALSGSATAAQEATGINFFDLAHSDAGSPTCWDNNKSYIYKTGSAVFTACSTNFVPITSDYLVFTTKKPSGSSWHVDFELDWGHSVNFLRYGNSPLLYLRVKWGAIATGADLTITLVDDQQIKSLYRSYNGTGTNYTDQSASVTLSKYVTPSTTVWQDVYIPMADFMTSNSLLDLTRIGVFRLAGAGTYSTTNTMYIEKIKVVPSISNQYADMVKVNQLGYLTNGRKLAIVSYEAGTVSPAPTYFQVKDANSGAVVYQANLQLTTASWDASGDTVYHADFTAFTIPGQYVIYSPETGQISQAFYIGVKAFDEAFRDSLRFYYFARSGNEIAEPFAEGHTRPTIYTSNSACAYDYDDNNSTKMYDYDPNNIGITTRDVRGGWFDAGDLHLDIHNNITPLWFLLEMLEQQKNKLGPNTLNLPESDGQTNDLVWLIKYQLDWFKKMQNTDGSVHFIVYAPPNVYNLQKISDVSTGAACVLAGIFAKAYTQFSTIPGMESYSEDLLSRAQLSWSWLMAHTATYDPCSPGIGQWSYGITDDTPYRGFAAIELYLATGQSEYCTYFESRFSDPLNSFGGNSYYGYMGLIGGSAISKGYMDYAEETVRPVTASIRTAIRNSFLTEANLLVSNVGTPAATYRTPMLMFNDLYWGSSSILCGNAYVLLRAYEWTGNSQYRDTALDSLEWICGRNPVSRIFITGDYSDYLHGTDHYSFYMFDHLNPVPGYLCGNINMQDGYLLAPYIKHSWKYYLNLQNASILEPCISYQAQMCYLLGYFAYDLKLSEIVDYSYLSEFAQAWLSSPGDTNWNPNFDLAVPSDGVIDFTDFAVIANHWLEVN